MAMVCDCICGVYSTAMEPSGVIAAVTIDTPTTTNSNNHYTAPRPPHPFTGALHHRVQPSTFPFPGLQLRVLRLTLTQGSRRHPLAPCLKVPNHVRGVQAAQGGDFAEDACIGGRHTLVDGDLLDGVLASVEAVDGSHHETKAALAEAAQLLEIGFVSRCWGWVDGVGTSKTQVNNMSVKCRNHHWAKW